MPAPVRRPFRDSPRDHFTVARSIGEVIGNRVARYRVTGTVELANTDGTGAVVDMLMVMHPSGNLGVELRTARAIGVARHAFMLDFFTQLDREMAGEMAGES